MALVQHITGSDVQDAAAFLSPTWSAHNSFQYTEQVEQLGFTEAAAKEFSIGFYRGQVYIPIRHSGGSISGFVGYADGQMKLPPNWLPATSHVVTVSRKNA